MHEHEHQGLARTTGTRRPGAISRLVTMLIALLTLLAVAAPAIAQGSTSARDQSEMPTSGGMRPGPVGLNPPTAPKKGVQPVAIKIEKAEVDAEVEVTEIVGGAMQDPSGPFVVAWYKETGKLGENGNIVMSGHLDYWDAPEAVFFHLGELEEGDLIEVTGADKAVYRYEVEWVEYFSIDDLNGKKIGKIVGKTPRESVTLITCGGPFDIEAGQYLERMVVRASRVVT